MESLRLTKKKILLICLAVLAIAITAVTFFKVPLGNLFYLAIFLSCPLMHLFMMKDHGGHHDHQKEKETKEK